MRSFKTEISANRRPRSELSTEQRAALLEGLDTGENVTKLAQKFGVARSTIYRTQKRFQNQNSLESGAWSGRPEKLSQAAKRYVLLIGLMSLQNQLVYIQFHPVVYVAKLNIELAMADLLKETARLPVVSYSENGAYTCCFASPIQQNPKHGGCTESNSKEGIHKAMDFEIWIETVKQRTEEEVVV